MHIKKTNDFPIVSVVIVNWNHGQDLPNCLEALQKQDYCPLQIIIVDNASKDNSAEWVEKNAPFVHLIKLEKNVGFARGFNIGATQSNTRWVASINPDIIVRPNFFTAMLMTAKSDDQIGICAPKLLRADSTNILDSTGLFYNRWRQPYDRGQMKPDDGYYDSQIEIFGACGAAALYRRAMLEDVSINNEFLDEDLFAYYEDIDVAWRAQMRGWRAVYVPDAVAEHARGWGDTLRKSVVINSKGLRLALRNRYLIPLKNDAWRYILIDLPGMIFLEIPRLVYLLIRCPSALLGLVDFLRTVCSTLHKRKLIRGHQIVSDQKMRIWFTHNWND